MCEQSVLLSPFWNSAHHVNQPLHKGHPVFRDLNTSFGSSIIRSSLYCDVDSDSDDSKMVVLLQVIMKLMEMLDPNSDYITMLVKKLSPPLVTLLSAEPEIQYVALRNINLIVQKR